MDVAEMRYKILKLYLSSGYEHDTALINAKEAAAWITGTEKSLLDVAEEMEIPSASETPINLTSLAKDNSQTSHIPKKRENSRTMKKHDTTLREKAAERRAIEDCLKANNPPILKTIAIVDHPGGDADIETIVAYYRNDGDSVVSVSPNKWRVNSRETFTDDQLVNAVNNRWRRLKRKPFILIKKDGGNNER